MDYHGVGREGQKANVLGAIDLDALHVELRVMQHRTAENTKRFVRDRILFRHGTPAILHSDHARELIGRVMTSLASTFGYINTSTGGYCSTGNSVIESFWSYFNICLRLLSDKDYEDVHDHIQQIAWVWNTTIRSSIGVRPFEVMSGTTPVTISDTTVLPAPIGHVLDMSNISESTAAYTKVAREHGDYMRAERARVLNKHGRKLKALKVGDFVKIYVPPSHSEAVRRRRKAKHICQWRGPLRITKKLSNTTFELVSHFDNSKIFRRHLMNVRCWLGPVPDADSASDSDVLISDISAGEYAFVRDSNDPDDILMHCVIFAAVNDTCIDVAAWGTSAKNHVTGTYRPVVILRVNNKPTTRPGNRHVRCNWTWQIPIAGVDEMILLRQLEMLPGGHWTAKSARRVKLLKKLPGSSKKLKFRRYRS
jgi:hypothetical protein